VVVDVVEVVNVLTTRHCGDSGRGRARVLVVGHTVNKSLVK
jgi:hypothetical protein